MPNFVTGISRSLQLEIYSLKSCVMKTKLFFAALTALALSCSVSFAQGNRETSPGRLQISGSVLSRISGVKPYYGEASVGYYLADDGLGFSVDGIYTGDSDVDETWGVYLSGYIGTLSADKFQMVPKLGLGAMRVGNDDVKFSAKFNVELRYYISSNTFCGFDCQYLMAKDHDVLVAGPKIGLAF